MQSFGLVLLGVVIGVALTLLIRRFSQPDRAQHRRSSDARVSSAFRVPPLPSFDAPAQAPSRPSQVSPNRSALASLASDSMYPATGFREYHPVRESQRPRGEWSVISPEGGERWVTAEQLAEMQRTGEITPETSVRKEGMASYAPLASFREFQVRGTAE